MRLAQLARKIGKSQSEIIKFLGQQNITVLEGSNSRIEPEDTMRVITHFAPALLLLEPQPNDAPPLEQNMAVEPISTQNDLAATQTEPTPIAGPIDLVADETLPDSANEVIKAPKIELAGLKVIGKIALPESKKKALIETPLPEVEQRPKKANHSKEFSEPRHARREPYKNPIAQQREKEELEKELKKKEAAAYEKELRTQRYLNKVRRPTESLREVNEQPTVQTNDPKPARKKDTSDSIFSTFFKWLSPNK